MLAIIKFIHVLIINTKVTPSSFLIACLGNVICDIYNIFHPSTPLVFGGVHVAQYIVFCVMFCGSLFFFLAIVLSVLWYTVSQYTFSIFTLFLCMTFFDIHVVFFIAFFKKQNFSNKEVKIWYNRTLKWTKSKTSHSLTIAVVVHQLWVYFR